MEKSIGVIGTFLLGMVICSCAPKEQTPQKQYPDEFPVFNINWVSSTPDSLLPFENYVLDHFISGNSYVCHITVKEESKSFAYQEDFSFKCNKDVFQINPYWEAKENQLSYAFTFLVEIKSFSEDNKITVCYLDKETNVIDIPIVERNEKLAFYSFDYESETQRREEVEALVNKVTLVSSKAQYDSYPSLVSSQLGNNIDDSFFNTRNLVYIVLSGHLSAYKYDKYFIEDGYLFFRITKYHSGKQEHEPALYDSACGAYAVIISKTDGDAFNDKIGAWTNIRFSL